MKKGLFISQYLAPISYYKELLSCDEVGLEQYNHYERKTYQNRCEILSANGVIALSIPIEKSAKTKTPFNEVRIAYHTDWQKQHLRAIMSAYQNSPFYDYYIDDIRPLYEKNYTLLIDFNKALHQAILEAIEEERATSLTDVFYEGDASIDRRFDFHPKKRNEELKPYTQVFSDKIGFVSDLSILDLLFNLGPEVELYLKAK